MLDSLCQGECLAGAIGSNDKDWGQKNRDRGGDGQDGLFLLGIQSRIQLFIPLPEGRGRIGEILRVIIMSTFNEMNFKNCVSVIRHFQAFT